MRTRRTGPEPARAKTGRRWPRRIIAGLATGVFACVLTAGAAAPADAHPPGDAIITNGVVTLGIHPQAHLNVEGPPSSGGTPFVGVRYNPTGSEATAPGCLCEGWGAADAISGVTGYANEAVDGVVNITPISFVATASTAISVVEIGTTLRVTHDYHPSPTTPNLYEVVVTIQNISASTVEPRYRRVMDWDVEPTPFSEFVTIETGTATNLLYSSDNGFETANPLGLRSAILFTGEAVDSGPTDHGALFDFGFDPLAPGAQVQFKIFYGAGATEAEANAAVAAVGAEVYSYGQCDPAGNVLCSPTTGTPNTFIFAFSGVGGAPVFADVNVTKAADDAAIDAGETAAFTIVVRNPGADPATSVTLEDVLPPGVTWAEDHADCTIVGTTMTCAFGDVPPGGSETIHLTGTTDRADCGTLTNTATVAATNDPNPANNAATATITVTCPPLPADVTVTKTAVDANIDAGETAAFTIVVSNPGANPALDVMLRDVLPPNVTWAVPSGCTAVANVITCDLGTIAAGGSATVNLTGTTDRSSCGVLTNTATVTASNDPNPANNAATATITVTCPPLTADVTVTKTAVDASIDAGETAAFTIVVSNPSANPATSVTLEDVLPPGVTWSEDHADCTIVGTTMTCMFGDIPGGGSETIHLTGTTDRADCGTLTNTATVAATNDPNPANNTATATITVNCPPVGRPPLDHFKCYGASTSDNVAAGRRVTLQDQFGRSTATINKLYNFCNPVDKNGEGIEQPDAHLTEYKLVDRRAASGKFKKFRVEAKNQFGTVTLVVQKPNRLLVPSAKALAGTVPGAIPSQLDHFLCYKVHSSSRFAWRGVTLEDQFMEERATVKKPRMLCNPVSKNGEGIQSPKEHLVCYVTRSHGRPSRHGIVVRNQFGVTSMTAWKTRHLCVPSTKTIL